MDSEGGGMSALSICENPSESKFIIYGLRDPRTNEIRYVGKSTEGIKRPRRHSSIEKNRNFYKTKWVTKLRSIGLMFSIVVLQELPDAESLWEAEREWIRIGRSALGNRLTNKTDGGEGTPGYVRPIESRQRIAEKLRNKPQTPENLANLARMSAAHKGKKRPPRSSEWCKKIGDAQRGLKRGPLSLEHRQKLSEKVVPKKLLCHKGHELIDGNLKIIFRKNGLGIKRPKRRCLICWSDKNKRQNTRRRERRTSDPLVSEKNRKHNKKWVEANRQYVKEYRKAWDLKKRLRTIS